MPARREALTAKWLTTYSQDSVQSLWASLYVSAGCKSPFLHPSWVITWLSQCQRRPALFIVEANAQPVAAVFIGEQDRSDTTLPLRTALLNQSGNSADDQAWIEYNDMLCMPGYSSSALRMLLQALKQQGYDRLGCSMLDEKSFMARCARRMPHTDMTSTRGFVKHLSHFSLQHFSSNARSQLRRSDKNIVQSYGPIEVIVAATPEARESFLSALAELHIAQWGQSEQGSGFSNRTFVALQRALLLTHPTFAEIICVKAGEQVLGFCINLLHNNTCFFYCSGVNHALAVNPIKPGYSLHLALMQHYASRGFERYDFLGGESQYKTSLSDITTSFVSIAWPLPTLKGSLLKVYYYQQRKCATRASSPPVPGSPPQ